MVTRSRPPSPAKRTTLDGRQFPGRAVGPRDHLLRLRVADHRLPLDVPPDHAAQALGHVAEVAGDHRIVADLDVRPGALPGPHAVDEVLDVLQVVLLLARALPWESDRLVLPQPLVDPVRLRVDLPPGAIHHQGAVLTHEGDAVLAGLGAAPDAEGVLPDHG